MTEDKCVCTWSSDGLVYIAPQLKDLVSEKGKLAVKAKKKQEVNRESL